MQSPDGILQPAASLPPPLHHHAEHEAADGWHHTPWQLDGRGGPSRAAALSSHSAHARPLAPDGDARTSFVASLLSASSQQMDGAARGSVTGGLRSLRAPRVLPPLSPLTAAMAIGHEGRCARQDGWAVLDHLQTLNVRAFPDSLA